jgi:hypothetical protein
MAVRQPSPLEARLCFKLYRAGCFGKGHKLVSTVLQGVPTHARGEAGDALERLARDGVLVKHPTKHGVSVYIGAKYRLDVWERLREHKEFAWLPK